MKNAIKIIIVLVTSILLPNNIYGQKLLADQVPINRTMKSLDSLMFRCAKNNESYEDIYQNSWNITMSAFSSYNKSLLPETYKIDLRDFTIPIPEKSYAKVTSQFGYRPRFGRMHYGVDLKVYTGDTIKSAFAGKVRVKKFDANGYGYYIVIRHKNGLETLYAHLSKQLVEVNQEVKSGQPIGLGGNTGRSFGSHLHFETRIVGIAINPELLFDFKMRDVTQDYYVFHKEKQKTNKQLAVLPNNRKEQKHFYKVKSGDTLEKISKKLGVNINTLCELNQVSKNKTLTVGRLIRY